MELGLGVGGGQGRLLGKKVPFEIRLKDTCEFGTGALGSVKQAKEAGVTGSGGRRVLLWGVGGVGTWRASCRNCEEYASGPCPFCER